MSDIQFIDIVPVGLYEENQQVTGYIYGETPLGYKVCFDDKYTGLLYRDELFEEYEVDQKVDVFIKRIRADMKVDLSIRKIGYVESIKDARTKILSVLERNNGLLNLSDKSTPEEIYKKIGISKKKFKHAIGSLYKEKILKIYEDRIELTSRQR